MGQLDGKIALVTGGASGIGRATSELLASEGARVCVVDRDEQGGTAVASAIGGIFVAADCGDSSSADAAFARGESELGGIDIAYLNAGVTTAEPDITQLDDAAYERIQRVNVDGVFYGARAAVRAMERRGGGAIVATSSLAGIIPFPPDPVYDGGKHWVVGFVRSLAPTLAAKNITINTVNPGITDTNLVGAQAKARLEAAGFPVMPASQIAAAVLGLVTSGVTGQCWVCQAGREPVPYEFRDVPGPRGQFTGKRPPANVSSDPTR
jgi:NAD(P)-dependent dehydrogenase (short-subunit alcohol dehydrogenase family)